MILLKLFNKGGKSNIKSWKLKFAGFNLKEMKADSPPHPLAVFNEHTFGGAFSGPEYPFGR